MKAYRLGEDGFEPAKRTARKQIITKAFILFLVVSCVGTGTLVLLFKVAQGTATEKKLMLWFTVITCVPLFLFVFLWSIIQVSKKLGRVLRDRWDSYELILTPESIIRREANATEIEIYREEIIKIQEIVSVAKSKELQIKTAQSQTFINVPASLEGYDEVKSYLAEWNEIEAYSPKKNIILSNIFVLLYAGSFILLAVSQSLVVVVLVGIYILVYTWLGIIQFRRLSHVAPKLKRRTLFGFPFILLIVIAKIFSLLQS